MTFSRIQRSVAPTFAAHAFMLPGENLCGKFVKRNGFGLRFHLARELKAERQYQPGVALRPDDLKRCLSASSAQFGGVRLQPCQRPIVGQLFGNLRQRLGNEYVPVPCWPQVTHEPAQLRHDVDKRLGRKHDAEQT